MQPGHTYAHYEILGSLGRGGMGEVYRAHDTRLGRDVALKVLPPEFGADPDRLARFEREAKVLASLHHPNIASIFGFETEGDRPFLVMELVEGDDLAEILRRGPLPVDEAVDVARQIAEGLEEAHEKGIVHRDLKPANVKRTPDGKVKVLDFGLARAFAGQSAGEEAVSSAPTMTAAMTQVGTVLGTAAYMSPEQARGKEVDRRADIWAFGVILFEMLTGKQTFAGETASDTLAGILKSEPDWSALPGGLPYQVERVLRRCLAKDPRQRLRDIGEARVRLEDPDSESGLLSGAVAAMPAAAPPTGRALRLLPWLLLAASVAAAAWLAWSRPEAPARAVVQLEFSPPEEGDLIINASVPGLPQISPDGRRVVFTAAGREDKIRRVYVRALDSGKAVVLGDTKDASYPFWSPDSRSIAYYKEGSGLMKISLDGGPSQLVCRTGGGKGGSWNQFDEILFTTEFDQPISVVSAAGGEPRQVTDLNADEGFNSHRHPQFLPDGRRFLYFARGTSQGVSEVRLASLDGGPAKAVLSTPSMAIYASGHLLSVNQGVLVARPFDPESGAFTGAQVALVDEILTITGAAVSAFSASQEGSLVYLSGLGHLESTLTWRDRTGRVLETIVEPGPYLGVELSPTGDRAAVSLENDHSGTWDIWTIELERNLPTRFTFGETDEADPVWSSDGRTLWFISDRKDHYAAYAKDVGSPESPREAFDPGVTIRLWDVTSDRRTVIYSTMGDGTAFDMWTADLDGGAEPRLLLSTQGNDGAARLSPDEKWLSFANAESGTWQTYVAPWPAMSPVTQVSTTSGTWSAWTKGGAELIYLSGPGELWAAPLEVQEGNLRVGLPERLFDGAPVPDWEVNCWAATPDGSRILTVNSSQAEPPAECRVLIGWPELTVRR